MWNPYYCSTVEGIVKGPELLPPESKPPKYLELSRKGGAALEQIQINLGHESLETTQKYLAEELDYQHALAACRSNIRSPPYVAFNRPYSATCGASIRSDISLRQAARRLPGAQRRRAVKQVGARSFSDWVTRHYTNGSCHQATG